MRTKAFLICCILCAMIFLVLVSCATMRSPDKMVYERFCGTWANLDYEGKVTPPAKWIINPDGTYIGYQKLIQTGPTGVGNYIVEKRWTDASGNSFYNMKTYSFMNQVTQYELWKIDKYNAVFEYNYSNNDYPAAIDPKDKHSTYEIYYRY